MLAWLRRGRQVQEQARSLYAALVRLARDPVFYREKGVPDTFEGRFDLLVLLTCLVLRRLRQLGPTAKPLSQALVDTLFENMDVMLRETGVSDNAVPKKVRTMAEAFYGRARAYEDGLGAPQSDGLEQAVSRNVMGNPDAPAQALAAFARNMESVLASVPLEQLAAGELPANGPV